MLAFLDTIPYGTPRLRRIAFWFATTFVAYVLIGFFLLPPVIKNMIQDECRTALNRATSIERVAFNPLTLHFEIEKLTVKKREGDDPFVSVGSLSVSPGLSSIWKLAPVISYLHLRNLYVDITFFGDGKYSISDLMGSRQKSEEDNAKDADEEGTVFPFALYGFEMTNATIVFDDRSHDKRHVISDLNLLVPFTSSFLDLRKEFTQPKFTAVVNGDPIELKGRTLPFDDTLLTEFELGAVDVDLHQYWRYLPVESPLQLVKGRFTSDISLFFERPDAQRLNLFLGGGGKLSDLELSAPGDGKVLSLNELNFAMERFSLGDNELSLTSVVMDTPYFKVIRRKDNAINWAGYFPGSEVTPKGAKVQTPTEDAPLLLDIRDLEVRDGTLDWHDQAVPGGFKRTFPRFALRATELSTHGDRPSRFDASIGKEGVTKLDGIVTMQPLTAKVTVTGSNFNIPAYKPYLDQALPLVVDSATASFSVDIDFRLDESTPYLAATNGTLTLDNLAMRKHDAEKPSITLAGLGVTGTNFDLSGKTVEVGEVAFTAPSVSLVKEKTGQIDLVRLFIGETAGEEATPKPQKPEEKEPVDVSQKQWEATVKSVRMKEGAFSFKDFSLKHPAGLSLDGISADLANITTRKGETTTYDINTRWAKKGIISLNGKAVLDPLKGNGRLVVKSVALRPFDGHMGEHTELLFASGAASADLKYVFTGGGNPKFTATGDTALTNVRLKDNRGDGEFAGIDAFKLAGIRFSNEPYRLSIADIHLDGPSVAIDFDEKGRSNIRRAFRIPEPPPVSEKVEVEGESDVQAKAATEKPKPEAEKSFFETIDIGTVTMANGRVSYRDASVKPPYYTKLSDMKLGLIDIAQTEDARPKLNFSAKIGPTPISVNGVINPVIKPIYSDLAISVNGMELVPLSPYTIEHLAYPVEKGRLYADVKFKTEDWVLDASNKFYVEQLVLGPKDKRPDAPNVPVKFGLALLQDSNGNMELNLPITGRLDDPDFRIGGIVFKAIASLFIKALASPFTLIGSIFGGGENMDFVVFEPGHHRLGESGKQKLDTTIKALSERQRLKLDVDGVVDPVVDKNGLVEVIFQNKLKQQKYDSLTRKERAAITVDAMVVTPEEYEEFLYEAYADEPDEEGVKPTTLFMTDRQPVKDMEKFILDRIIVTDEDLKELARRRAASVKEYIITEEPALTQRIFLLDRQKTAGKTGVPLHRADLGIK